MFWSGGKVLVIDFRKYITSRGLRTLCSGPETPTKWKSESVTNGPTGGLTGEGARDAYASENSTGRIASLI